VRNIIKLIVVLFLFCAISGGGLAVIKEATKDQIEYQELKARVAPAVKAVLPPSENDPIAERVKIPLGKKQIVTVFPAKKGGKLFALAYGVAGSGHGGPIQVMVGLSVDGKILGIKIVRHSETPGIGTKANNSQAFLDQFKGKSVNSKIALTSAGGSIEAVSGATESSTGITEGVAKAVKLFSKIKNVLETKG